MSPTLLEPRLSLRTRISQQLPAMSFPISPQLRVTQSQPGKRRNRSMHTGDIRDLVQDVALKYQFTKEEGHIYTKFLQTISTFDEGIEVICNAIDAILSILMDSLNDAKELRRAESEAQIQ